MELMEHQKKVIPFLDSGKILWGGVGSGKSATVLAYYVRKQSPRDIYIITTAKKRDSLDWEGEAARFGIGTDREATFHGVIHVDSWNNIKKYTGVKNAFFVFDEQRLVGYGSWVRAFFKITKNNTWVLLSATPGDNWMDYAPVFIANGFFSGITQFKLEHVLYEPYVKYPRIRGYLNERKLELLRNEILVEMPYIKDTEQILNYMDVGFDSKAYETVVKRRWNIYEGRPIKDASELFRVVRRLVNSDPSRLETIKFLMTSHDRLIIFYNFDYELVILRTLKEVVDVFEWNGHKKELVPDIDKWVYLVQYVSGAEGWNCISTNCMVLYSLTYSYKNFVQCRGRIDRLNSPYLFLYYYILVSHSNIDFGILKALKEKRSFNESNFVENL